MLALALLMAGLAIVVLAIWSQTSLKARRQRRIEREHARSKLRNPAR